MGSIANLAVVISGHTKPLEDSMKRAQSKMSGFDKAFNKGLGIGAGAIGAGSAVELIKGSFKSAIDSSEDIKEQWEVIDKTFGRISASLWNIKTLTPIVSQTAQAVEQLLNPDNLSKDWQVFKEQSASLVLSADTRGAKLQSMRTEYEEATKAAKLDEIRTQLAKDQLKAQQAKQELVKSELESYAKKLGAELDALEPFREKQRLAEQMAQNNDVFLKAEIELKEMRKQELTDLAKKRDILKGIVESAIKLRDEGAEITKQQMTDTEKAEAEKTRLTKVMMMGGLDIESYNRAMQQQEDIIMRTSDLPGFDEASELADTNEKLGGTKLSGAATAGSEAAYSIIANAQANQTGKMLAESQTQTKELRSQTKLLTEIKDTTPKPGDFAFGVYRMQL